MPTTTNNGWTIPADTDLVKNGALAIRTLGNAIDTTLGVYVASSPGLVKLSTQTFTTASTVSFAANTFTSTYNTYFFTFDCIGSTAVTIRARLRAAGTDNTSAQYSKTEWAGDSAPLTISANSGQTSWDVVSLYDSDAKRSGINFTLTDVQVSGRYKSGVANFNVNLSSGNVYPLRRAFALNNTTSYDSITFLTDTGTMTGSITCYGYAQ
jgi:hypothetical protein